MNEIKEETRPEILKKLLVEAKANKITVEPWIKLIKDLADASKKMSDEEARYLVGTYYSVQKFRIRTGNQLVQLYLAKKPYRLTLWSFINFTGWEYQIKRSLQKFVEEQQVGEWLLDVDGIGPVIAAGLLAHIDIHRAPNVGHIWNFAGISANQVWKKGEKRPWNAELKTLCWKAGQSFMKRKGVGNQYNELYLNYKQRAIIANNGMKYEETALILAKKVGKNTEAYGYYSKGKLPPGHIDARARRYAVKIFLSHLHEYWYEHVFGKPCPAPYAIEKLGHETKIEFRKAG